MKPNIIQHLWCFHWTCTCINYELINIPHLDAAALLVIPYILPRPASWAFSPFLVLLVLCLPNAASAVHSSLFPGHLSLSFLTPTLLRLPCSGPPLLPVKGKGWKLRGLYAWIFLPLPWQIITKPTPTLPRLMGCWYFTEDLPQTMLSSVA